MAKATTKTAVVDEPVIYLGPNIVEPGFVIQSTAIYSNGLPDSIATRCAEDADFKRLFVPTTKAAKAQADLRTRGTPIRQAYDAVYTAYLKRKGGK